MANLNNENDHLIPLLWESGGPNPSPFYNTRGALYNLGGVPHAEFGGTIPVVGGYPSGAMNYQPQYNSIVNNDSPLSMELSMVVSGDEIILSSDVEVTGNISTTNNRVVFLLTYNFSETWFSTVVAYNQATDFNLTSIGETDTYEISFPMDPDWSLVNLKGVALVQSFGNTHQILQGVSTMFSGLLPMFSANVQAGPPNLAVRFTSNSFPQNGIVSWEWDFDGDGIFDSTDENPYHIYDTPGTYDVTLRISDGNEFAETTNEAFIVVNDGSDISGNAAGIWTSEFNPYTITGDLTINEGDTLIIEPGVEIRTENYSQILVNGRIVANAENDEPIIFTSDSSWKGIKFYNSEEDNLIKNCKIENAFHSALEINNSTVTITGNIVSNNSGSNAGAALDLTNVDEEDVLIHNNIFSHNSNNGMVGALAFTSSTPTFTNNIVVYNTGTTGGAISLKSSSDIIFLNNTFAYNSASNGSFFIFSSNPSFKNCIIYDDEPINFNEISGAAVIVYSCVTGGHSGLGNIDENPLFALPSPESWALWYLMENSPCIDAGHPSTSYYDVEDPNNPGFALWPAMGTLTNDMGAFGGEGFALYPNMVQSSDNEISANNPRTEIQLFPNPFNPNEAGTISISLKLAQSGEEKPSFVEIYNVKGQKIKQIPITTNKDQILLNWDGKDKFGKCVNSGIYFIGLTTDSKNIFRRLLLIN